MIELRNITVSLPHGSANSSTILDSISLTIEHGEWVVLAGPNGSGKTTLLMTIAGLVPVAAGELIAEGVTTEGTGIGLLLQEPDNQFVASSVRNELLLSLPPSLDEQARGERLSRAVEQFSLREFLDRNPHRLSGGEKQRLAFATVWLSNPRLLLLDEPTSYLDAVERERCVRFVEELNDDGVTTVWATPFVDKPPADRRVIHIDDGRIEFDGTAGLYADEGRAAPLPGSSGGDRSTAKEALPEQDDPSVVAMHSVSFGYEERPVFEDFSLDLRRGECVALSGRNGSGKSTLLGLLSGVLEPVVGKIQRLYPKAVEKRRQNLFYLFQNPERLFFAESVQEEIAFGLKSLKTPRGEIARRVDEALAQVGLPPAEFRDRMPFSLSFGEMRRLAFAIALALDPRFLLMDEPASCLDAAGVAVLFDLISHFKNKGYTVALASHDVEMFSHLVDRVIEL
jgi:energy-coupling factor transport system ATP-binding protein